MARPEGPVSSEVAEAVEGIPLRWCRYSPTVDNAMDASRCGVRKRVAGYHVKVCPKFHGLFVGVDSHFKG